MKMEVLLRKRIYRNEERNEEVVEGGAAKKGMFQEAPTKF
jgi:hypothetical protein